MTISEEQLDQLERAVEERRMLSWGEMYDLIAEVRRLQAENERLRSDARLMAPYVGDGDKPVWEAVDRWLQAPPRGHQP